MTKASPDNPTAEFTLTFDDEEVKVVVEFHFSDNADDFFDVTNFVNAASAAVLRLMR